MKIESFTHTPIGIGMTNSRLARSAFAFAAIAAIGACSSGTTSSSSAPAPAPAPSSSASTAAARPATPAAPAFTAAMVKMGDSLYHARGCRNCHGMDAKGAANGPTLITTQFMHVNGSYADFVRIITDGVPAAAIKDQNHKIPMPARGGTRPAAFTDDQINAVAAYVYSLNHP